MLAALLIAAVSAPAVSAAAAPPGTEGLAVQWLRIAAPGSASMLAAVARPSGPGPFPAVILLHGSHGFAREYVKLAQALARGGVLAVAPCWFSGGGGAGSRFVTPVACPDAPPLPPHTGTAAQQIIEALVQATRALPGVRSGRVALFGHSRGGGAALGYLLEGGDAQAAILDSAGYPRELAGRVSGLKAPILMLHGVADGPADGGSPVTAVQMARTFEAELRRAGKVVDARYYEGAGHNGIFTDPAQQEDEVRRMVAFLLRHLGK